MSPEQTPTFEVESVKNITEDLRERYVSTPMEAGVGYVIPPLENIENAMGTCGNPEDGLDQYLLGLVVAANKDVFAIVDVSAVFKFGEEHRPSMVLKTAITHHIPGKRGDFVCFIENNNVPKSVGRTGVGKFDAHTSREHFSVSQDTDGTLIVTDISSNGSELFIPVAGSKFGLKEGINHHTDTNNPLEDFDFWSVKSASMRDEFEKTIQIER
jgi:hypothetical protein